LNRPRSSFFNNWLIRGLSTTVGQKLVMGATGLLLCGFLVVHLAGNLLLFGGQESYDRYAEALHSNELLPLAEVGLFVLFILHILLAFVTTRENTAARPVGYAEKETKQDAGVIWQLRPQSTMFLTGAIVLGFLLLHLLDMRFPHVAEAVFGRTGLTNFSSRFQAPEGETAFQHTVRVLQNPLSATVYIIGSLFLGWHLAHGFQSAFRSLGFAHPKYTPFLKGFGYLFAIIIAFGFASLPLLWFTGSMN